MHNPYPPALYAELHVGNPGDLAFYREHCVGASSILELGCGYGRVMTACGIATVGACAGATWLVAAVAVVCTRTSLVASSLTNWATLRLAASVLAIRARVPPPKA